MQYIFMALMAAVIVALDQYTKYLVVANIVADVLIAMSQYLPSWMTADGHLILSGIIDTRAEEVRQAFKKVNMVIVNEIARDGWVMLCCKKGGAQG